jgi:hypothetical protein
MNTSGNVPLRGIADTTRRVSAPPASLPYPFCRLLLVAALVGFLVPVLHAQEIQIKVLNARNGKTITNECLNVWLGPTYRENLIAPTNSEGIVILHLERNEIRADTVSPHACDGLATVGPKLLRSGVDSVIISGDYYVPCQEYGKPSQGEALKPSLNDTQVPSYSIKTILESGVASSNTCGKIRAEAKPGELVFFMRPRAFWERLRE